MSVVLLEPVPPRMPTVMPESMCRSISARAAFCASLEYLKDTPSKSTEPSRISVTGFSGFFRLGSVCKTSTRRFMLSSDMVIMT